MIGINVEPISPKVPPIVRVAPAFPVVPLVMIETPVPLKIALAPIRKRMQLPAASVPEPEVKVIA